MLRSALAKLLNANPEVNVIGEAADGLEAVDLALRLLPDVVVMDMTMPRLNGLEATRQIRAKAPHTRVIVLSAYGDPDSVGQAVAAGASGYIIKRANIEELVLALRLLCSGNTYFSRELTEKMDIAEIIFNARTNQESPTALTDREREILQLIAEGHTMKEIADMLVISARTVDGHNTHIMAKIGARNRADLVRYAISHGLVRLDQPPEF
jgi:two-component system response regulator NreC